MDVEDLGFLGRDADAGDPSRSMPGGSAPPPPGTLRWWLLIAVAGLLAGAYVLAGRGATDPTPATPTAATALPTPHSYRPLATGIPGSVPYVSLLSVCPARIHSPRQLDVSFFVVNIATVDLRLDRLQLWLPPTGLITRAPPSSGGSCAAPANWPVQSLLAPNARSLFTLHLTLPRRCSAPLPVLAEFQFQAYGVNAIGEVALYDDLTRAAAGICPPAGFDPRNRLGTPTH